MSDLRDALSRSAATGGEAVAARLRAEGAAAALTARAHRRRRRGTMLTAAGSVAVLALAGTVAAELLRPPPDPAGPVHRGDVASIDRTVNPDAADLFVCDAVPDDVPEQGVTIPEGADRDAHPTVQVALFERYVDAGGEQVVVELPTDGSVAVDPDAALVFATTVSWGEDGPPETWGVATAGAVLGDDGTPVMIHDGVTVRGNLLPVVDQLRALEGGFDGAACGEGVAEDEYDVAAVIQVWAGDPTEVIATYVNPGWGDDAVVAVEDRAEELTLGQDDAARREQGELAQQVAAEGVPLTEAGGGYGPAAVTEAAMVNGTASCLRAAAAPTLDSIRVLPMAVDTTAFATRLDEVIFDNTADRDEAIELIAPIVAWTGERDDHPWVFHQFRSTLLLYDQSGRLVAVFEGDGTVGFGEGPDEGTVAKVFPYDPGCATPAEWPQEPGDYTAVYVADLIFLPGSAGLAETVVELGLAQPPDAWVLFPDATITEDDALGDVELFVPADRDSALIP